MKPKASLTWINFIERQINAHNQSREYAIDGIESLVNFHLKGFNILNHSVPMIYILDYTTGKYLYVSHQCQAHMEVSVDKMLDGGIGFLLERYHPADLKLFDEQVFPNRLKILQQIPATDHKDYIFSFNFRTKNDKGAYVNLLQRNAFVKSDAAGNPLVSLGVVTNIDHFIEESPVIQLVEKVDSLSGHVDLISKKSYYLREEDKLFSKREREILSHIADGLTSKEISDKLFISEHTVINHKRSMLTKSNTSNAAGLICFAFRQHLL